MADVYTKSKRSEIMSHIKGSKTSPENTIAHMLRKLKAKFRRNVKSILGQPDFVIPLTKKVVFVHGCFWHRHNCKRGRSMPSTRKTFWETKLNSNKERDKRVRLALHKEGWKVLVVWECQTKNIEKLNRQLRKFLIS